MRKAEGESSASVAPAPTSPPDLFPDARSVERVVCTYTRKKTVFFYDSEVEATSRPTPSAFADESKPGWFTFMFVCVCVCVCFRSLAISPAAPAAEAAVFCALCAPPGSGDGCSSRVRVVVTQTPQTRVSVCPCVCLFVCARQFASGGAPKKRVKKTRWSHEVYDCSAHDGAICINMSLCGCALRSCRRCDRPRFCGQQIEMMNAKYIYRTLYAQGASLSARGL